MKQKVDKGFLKELAVLALPAGCQQLVTQILLMIDNVMIGHLGEVNISTVTICNTFIWLGTTLITGIMGGAVVICAQEYGRNRIDRIHRITSLLLSVNIITSGIFLILMNNFPNTIMNIYTNEAEIIQSGIEYFKIAKFSLLFNAVYLTFNYVLNSVRDVKVSLYTSIVSCVVKITMNWIFIYGNLGVKSQGINGAAISVFAARFIEMLMVIVYVLLLEKKLKYRINCFNIKVEKKLIISLFFVALPMLFMEVSNNFISSVQTMITGHISKCYLSANSIVHSAWTIPSVIYGGIAMAAGIMIGNKIGEGKIDIAKKYARNFLPTTFVAAIVGVICLHILLPILSNFYNVSNATIELARKMGNFATITSFFMAYKIILSFGVIKATGKTKDLMILDFASSWLFAIPIGYISAFVLKFPPEYLYLILRSGAIIMALWSVHQIYSGKWIKLANNTIER